MKNCFVSFDSCIRKGQSYCAPVTGLVIQDLVILCRRGLELGNHVISGTEPDTKTEPVYVALVFWVFFPPPQS